MKHIVCAALASLLLSACGAELVTTTAITGTLQAQQAGAMRRQLDHATGTSGRINLEKAIQTFQAEKGYNPPSLDALVPQYIPAIPPKADGSAYGYDPSSGQLLGAPGAVTPSDQQTIAQIQQAITQYGTAVGFYPPTLDALAPVYLPIPPRTTDGREFIYNNQNGQVLHPGLPGGGNSTVPGGAAMGGPGPMGEVITSIGVQQQLGSGSSAGTSSASSYGRSNARDVSGAYSDRQMKAADELGL